MIGATIVLTTSGQRPHNFSPSSSINNSATNINPGLAALHMRQKSICECCGIIEHKANACIIRGPKFLSSSLKINKNNFNVLHDDEPNEIPREWNIQPTEAHFKYRTSPYKTNPVISAFMRRLNHHDIDNGDVKVPTSEFPVEYHSELVTDPDTTTIKIN